MRASRSIKACAVAAPLALFLTASPAVADQTIATVAAPTPVSAFAGRVAWSAFDPAKGTYRLMTETGGAVTAVPVPPRRAPFDVDLGPDRSGNTIAAYSRCRREPPRRNPAIGNAIAQMPDWSRGRGCDLYRFDFATGHERKIASASSAGASEFLPSIWKTRIAFARVYERRRGRAGDRAYLYVRALAGARGSLRVPAGSRSTQKFCTLKPRRCRLLLEPGPTVLDLAGRRLAIGWDSGGEAGPTSSAYVATVSARSARKQLISRVDSGDIQGREIVAPVLLDGQVIWTLTSFGDEPSNISQRYRIATGELSQAAIPGRPADPYIRPVLAGAVTGQSVVHLDSGLVPVGEPCTVQSPCIANPGCSAQQPCEVGTSEGLTYTRVRLPAR
jgi:hypothetical protein